MLALFDLDETLIAGDSAGKWIEFCVECKLVDSSFLEQLAVYAQQYKNKTIDMLAFMEFFLRIVAGLSESEVGALVANFIPQKIVPIVYPQMREILHTYKNERKILISATADFLVQPIAQLFDISETIASQTERKNGIFTGHTKGILSFHDGKVKRLQEYLDKDYKSLIQDSCFYSDSINDLPLLEQVKIPIVCNPDSLLAPIAQRRQWKCLQHVL
ncbi:MAG: HAD-IB family hydrolase [Helicobacter sp.]|nr:HAD-IB family hydrolase [Helicobacter sp.]